MFIAVRTGLEPATPCVTGMYSNQAELPHHVLFLLSVDSSCFPIASAKLYPLGEMCKYFKVNIC